MQELLLATKNPGKFHEIMEVIEDLPFKFLFLGDLEMEDGDFEEDGATFRENAYGKARYYAEKTGMLTLGEDSGILVDALSGELGVKSRRWGAGENASDQEWVDYFLERMAGESDRGARFVCNACVYGPDVDVEKYFEGETRGAITEGLQAPILKGLPLSSCFLPEGCEQVYAALGAAEKNKISHRGKTMKGVKEFLDFLAEK